MGQNTFDPNTDVPDLTGKVYVVTGGSAGIGFGIVAHLLQHNPAKIFLLSNKIEHGEDAVQELKKWGDTNLVEWKNCNLLSLKETDEVAKDLKHLEQMDALICNAGEGVGNYKNSDDGIDSHFQVNHLAQMHLALTVLPILQKTPNSRLVVQSSELHRMAPKSTAFASASEINEEDIGASSLYSRSKLAQVLFVKALLRRMEQGEVGGGGSSSSSSGSSRSGIPFMNATHPGAIVTDQQDQAVEAYGTLGKIGVAAVRPFMSDPVKKGCRSALFAATSEDVVKENIQGQYIVPDRKIDTPSDRSQDTQLQDRLWKLSEQLLESKLGVLSWKKPARNFKNLSTQT
ncbi:NAD(P)-binding protein [Xylona heveae TC161]|uniref:NAD(P)-binding protein n=1 Tax=Xylona heveae (strain CBS 132557 / TC161) TaxID=1328760 RepID=A0A165IVI8_XYLHT|nr:NAD(P)-binding protein [Xylona heveae TC161]KZF25443.1 NAD(P)-binding protein [Xylona heveae TC161]